MEQHVLFKQGYQPFGPYPLLRPALAFMAGILMAHYVTFPKAEWVYLSGIAILIIYIVFKSLLIRKKSRAHQKISFSNIRLWPLILFGLLGGLNYGVWQACQPVPYVTPDDIPLRFVATEKPTTTHIGRNEVQGILFLSAPDIQQGHVVRSDGNEALVKNVQKGDTLLFWGPVLPFPASACPDAFDQRAFYRKKGILSHTTLKEAQDVDVRKGDFQPGITEKIRLFSMDKSAQYFRNETARGIVLQMLLGIRADLDADTKEAFRNTGVMHILAVSGLHVGIIYLVLAGIAGFFFRRGSPARIVAVVVVLGMVWFYAVLAGFRPSVVRAALMLSFVAVGGLFKRRVPLLNSLSAAALLNLLWRPADLFDLGFMLSYAAVGGIALLYRPVYALWKAPSSLNRLWELTCLSLSAQAGTLGITLVYFGQFPLFFILANWVAVPAAGIIIYSALAFLLSPWSFLSGLLARWLEAFISVLLGFLKALDSIPYSSLQNLSLYPAEGMLITAIVFQFVNVLINPGYRAMRNLLVIAVIWIVFALVMNLRDIVVEDRLVLCGGKDAGFYVSASRGTTPLLRLKDVPPGTQAVLLSYQNKDFCFILSAKNREDCRAGSIIIWNDGRIIRKGTLTTCPATGDIAGPGIGVRRALQIKKILSERGVAIHAVSVDGYIPL